MGIIATIFTAITTSKWVVYVIEFLSAAVVVGGAGAWIMHDHDKAKAYDVLQAEYRSLESKYGCDKRPSVAERELATCLVARQPDADRAAAAEIAKQREDAARQQALLDQAEADADKVKSADDAFIDQDARAGDGPVPKVLLDSWARERALRGAKK